MKLLITGSNGFVGKHAGELMEFIPLQLNGQRVDITDRKAVRLALNGLKLDAVLHLAAQSFVPQSFDDPRATFETNLFGTLNILEALKVTGFEGKFLYVGTGDVYGHVDSANMPISEEVLPRPRNPYAVSKLSAEALCYQWSQVENFEIVIARPFNHIGPGQSRQFVVSDFAKQLVEINAGKEKPVLNVGKIDVTRDFTDVRDVVRGYLALFENGVNGEIYNVCSGRENSIESLIEKMSQLLNIEVEIVRRRERFRPNEQQRVVGSREKITRETSWEPEITIDQSLKDILKYWEGKIK